MSTIEKIICRKDFSYEPPYFYKNNLALRCELGMGNDNQYFINAKKRALEIFNILFQNGVDTFFFDDYIYDPDFDINKKTSINRIIAFEREMLKFSLGYQKRFPHTVIRDIPFEKEDNEDLIRKNRIICYPDQSFHAIEIINSQIDSIKDPLIHMVSFENECIFTIYDDRGCDIVFYDKNKFTEYYSRLKPYFLAYDLDLMQKRFDENQ